MGPIYRKRGRQKACESLKSGRSVFACERKPRKKVVRCRASYREKSTSPFRIEEP